MLQDTKTERDAKTYREGLVHEPSYTDTPTLQVTRDTGYIYIVDTLLPISTYTYINIYTHTHIYIYIYIYI
jgi:hypothetical protein